MSSPEGATFGRKRNFWQISTPPLGNLEARWTAITSRRKLVVRVGKEAAKTSAASLTAFELLAIESVKKKLKIPNFRQSPSTYAWQFRGAKMRYMRCLFDSTGPIFNLKFFPLYRVGLRNFRRICARALYDRACLNLNNSKRWRPTPEVFADLVHTYVCYEKLL